MVDEEGNKTGCLFWSWMFHNAVNTRKKKPTITWDTCQNFYLTDGTNFCSSNCGSKSKNTHDSDKEGDSKGKPDNEDIGYSLKNLSEDSKNPYSPIEVTIVDNSIREKY